MDKKTDLQIELQSLIESLENETLDSWFDFGLYLDRLRDNRIPLKLPSSFKRFKMDLEKDLVYVAFQDAANIRDQKKLRKIFSSSRIHSFFADGFKKWQGSYFYFEKRLSRGSSEYNELIVSIKREIKEICEKLGQIIVENNARLLVLDDVVCNPGNVALAYSIALLTEHLNIFVVANNRTFHWENTLYDFATNKHLGEVFSLIEVLYPYRGRGWLHQVSSETLQRKLIDDLGLNPFAVVVDSKKYNDSSFLFKRLWELSKPDKKIVANIKRAFLLNKKRTNYEDGFKKLVLCKNRSYLPGINRNEFLIYLKSIIDPSFFRVEENQLRALVMRFVCSLEARFTRQNVRSRKQLDYFYKHLGLLFEYYKGDNPTVVDHSLAYRHRSSRIYPYRQLTEVELCGVVGILFRELVASWKTELKDYPVSLLGNDLQGTLGILAGAMQNNSQIDDRNFLLKDLESNKPIACFLSDDFKAEATAMILYVLKKRLGKMIDQSITAEDLNSSKAKRVKGILFFVRKDPLDDISYDLLNRWLKENKREDIRLLYAKGFIKLVKTNCLSPGVHLGQLGTTGTKRLLEIKKLRGFVVAFGPHSYMLDAIDMLSYRLGNATSDLMANFMGSTGRDVFIQRVPAALRPSIAYPTPLQTPIEFHKIFKSGKYQECCEKLGETRVLKILREDADKFGNPIEVVLDRMIKKENDSGLIDLIEQSQISGVYKDKLTWTGAYVKVKGKLDYTITSSGRRAKTVLELIKLHQSKSKNKKKVKLTSVRGIM